jgi:hypothetical protein
MSIRPAHFDGDIVSSNTSAYSDPHNAMRYEIEGIHLHMPREDAPTEENKLIVARHRPVVGIRDRTYQVSFHSEQNGAVLKLAGVLASEDEQFLKRLVEADRSDYEQSGNRKNRYVAETKKQLPQRSIFELQGAYFMLTLNRSQKYELVERMCEVADVRFSRDRHLQI